MDSNKGRRGKMQVNVTLSVSEAKLLEEGAAASGMTKSQLIRTALLKHLEKRKEMHLAVKLERIGKYEARIAGLLEEEENE